MRIKKVHVRNFRLLKDVELCLDKHMTMIVGRNNSGKTSLAELFRRLLSEKAAGFRVEDFSLSAHSGFWDALQMARNEGEEISVRAALPSIEVTLTIGYDKSATSRGRDEVRNGSREQRDELANLIRVAQEATAKAMEEIRQEASSVLNALRTLRGKSLNFSQKIEIA